MNSFLVLQGPNLNLLGKREPEVYGSQSLDELQADLSVWAAGRSIELEFLQSNIEGELLDALQGAEGRLDGAVINPGGYCHTSVALRDCIAGLTLPVLEVHLSNLHARESWRKRTLSGSVALGVISGLGPSGYKLALLLLAGKV